MEVREIMSSRPQTINFDASVMEAARKMKSFDVGVLPVMKKDEIVGIVTDRDIVLRIIAEKLNPQTSLVSKAMTTDITYCSEDTDVREALRMMEEKKIHRLIVLGSDNSLTGILSVADIATKMHDEHLLCEVLERICEPAHVR